MDNQTLTGSLRKMDVNQAADDASAVYHFTVACGSDGTRQSITLNPFLGEPLTLGWSGKIECVHCKRLSRKSFGQGYCYPCFTRLAQCDTCMMAPERCHFHAGTCREPEWARQVCFQPHYVYLANSSGVKVGITRAGNLPTRWLDQGAVQALVIAEVASRQLSGLVEDILRERVADKTNWRTMLKGGIPELDLSVIRDDLWQEYGSRLQAVAAPFGKGALEWHENGSQYAFDYPVLAYPSRVTSINLDKTPQISGRLMGIKGQYLILDTGVINLRRFSGYEVSLNLKPNETEY